MSDPIRSGDPGPYSGADQDPSYLVALYDVTDGRRRLYKEMFNFLEEEKADAYYRELLDSACADLYEGNFEIVMAEARFDDNGDPEYFDVDVKKKSVFVLKRGLDFYSFREVK